VNLGLQQHADHVTALGTGDEVESTLRQFIAAVGAARVINALVERT